MKITNILMRASMLLNPVHNNASSQKQQNRSSGNDWDKLWDELNEAFCKNKDPLYSSLHNFCCVNKEMFSSSHQPLFLNKKHYASCKSTFNSLYKMDGEQKFSDLLWESYGNVSIPIKACNVQFKDTLEYIPCYGLEEIAEIQKDENSDYAFFKESCIIPDGYKYKDKYTEKYPDFASKMESSFNHLMDFLIGQSQEISNSKCSGKCDWGPPLQGQTTMCELIDEPPPKDPNEDDRVVANGPLFTYAPKAKKGVFRLPGGYWNDLKFYGRKTINDYLLTPGPLYCYQARDGGISKHDFISSLADKLNCVRDYNSDNKAERVWNYCETMGMLHPVDDTRYAFKFSLTHRINFYFTWTKDDIDAVDQFIAESDTFTQASCHSSLQNKLSSHDIDGIIDYFLNKEKTIERKQTPDGEFMTTDSGQPVYQVKNSVLKTPRDDLARAMQGEGWITLERSDDGHLVNYTVNYDVIHTIPNHYADLSNDHSVKVLFDQYYDGPQQGQLLIDYLKNSERSEETHESKDNSDQIWWGASFLFLLVGLLTVGAIYLVYVWHRSNGVEDGHVDSQNEGDDVLNEEENRI